MRGMATVLCPSCGAARTGSFRFCRTCGLDFDASEHGVTAPTPAVLGSLPDAAVAPTGSSSRATSQSGSDVIVIQKRHLKLLAAVVISALIGVMLAGSVVVPLFGESGVLFGSLAGIATVIVCVWLGLRFLRLTSSRR